jgi:hypothetical protein
MLDDVLDALQGRWTMPDHSLTYSTFVEHLIREVPELRPVFEEHIRLYDEQLPHVFMGDVTRFVIRSYHESLSGDPDARSRHELLVRTLTILERAMASQDARLRELISVSFLENLNQAREAYEGIRSLLGRELRRELKSYERQYGWPESL